MLTEKKSKGRKLIGRVSIDTKGAPGIFVEGMGLWDGQRLTD